MPRCTRLPQVENTAANRRFMAEHLRGMWCETKRFVMAALAEACTPPLRCAPGRRRLGGYLLLPFPGASSTTVESASLGLAVLPKSRAGFQCAIAHVSSGSLEPKLAMHAHMLDHYPTLSCFTQLSLLANTEPLNSSAAMLKMPE